MGLPILLFGFGIGWISIVLVEVEAGWMVIEIVEVVGLVGEQDWVVGKMGLDSGGIGDMQKVVDRDVDRPVDMSGYHEYTLANLEQVGLVEEAKFAKAWVHSMNLEQEFDNLNETTA